MNYALAVAKERTRHAAREFCICWALGAVVLAIANGSSHFDVGAIFAAAVLGAITGAALWLAYRFFRFVLGR